MAPARRRRRHLSLQVPSTDEESTFFAAFVTAAPMRQNIGIDTCAKLKISRGERRKAIGSVEGAKEDEKKFLKSGGKKKTKKKANRLVDEDEAAQKKKGRTLNTEEEKSL